MGFISASLPVHFCIRHKLHSVFQTFKEQFRFEMKVLRCEKRFRDQCRSDADLLLLDIQWLNVCQRQRRKQTDFHRLIICISGKHKTCLEVLQIIISAK